RRRRPLAHPPPHHPSLPAAVLPGRGTPDDHRNRAALRGSLLPDPGRPRKRDRPLGHLPVQARLQLPQLRGRLRDGAPLRGRAERDRDPLRPSRFRQREDRMTLTRRDVLRCGAGALALAAGCGKSAEAATTTVKVMSHPGQILPILTHHTEYLKKTCGVSLRILESPDPTSYLDAVKDQQTGGGRYDIAMFFPRFNGELATGYLRPLDDLIEKHGARPLFDNIVDAYRILYSEWGGRTVAAPVDGDVALMYYRKDAFENPDHRKRFKEKHGTELAAPRTWEEFARVAEFFTGWAWGPAGRPGFGFQSATWERAYVEQQWAPMMASAGGNWFTRDLKPGWNN